MSGLGIDFSCAGDAGSRDAWTSISAERHRVSDSGYQSLCYPQQSSRWSKSTRESHSLSFAATVSSDGSHKQHGHQTSHTTSFTAGSIEGRHRHSPAVREVERHPGAQFSPDHPRAYTTSGDRSQCESFLIPTRKAPLPPTSGPTLEIPSPSTSRRMSVSAQSMMKALGNRKKDVNIPPPLPLAIKIDDAPVIHFVTLPVTKSDRLSPAMTSPSLSKAQRPRKKSSDEPRTPRTPIISSVMRSLKDSLYGAVRRKSSTGSHLAVQVSSVQPSLATSPRDSDCNGARLVDFAEGNSPKSIVVGPDIPRGSAIKAIHRPSMPLVTFVKAPLSPSTRRPRTAPADRRTCAATREQAVPSPISPASMSTTQSPIPDIGPPIQGIFDVNYVNPWKNSYEPAASFVSTIPMSPGESLRHDIDPVPRPTMKTEASLYKQHILLGQVASENATQVKAPRPASFRYSGLQPASNVPSLRIADVDRLPNFLHLSPSVRSVQTSIDDFSARQSGIGTPSSAAFTSPGHVRGQSSRDMSNWISSTTFDKVHVAPAVPTERMAARIQEELKRPDSVTYASHEEQQGPLQDSFDQLRTSPPVFQDPFLARLASTPSDIAINRPRKSSLAVLTAQSTSRASSVGNVSVRRQSAVSAWSSTDFPTRPNRVEVRRQSEFAGRNRGIRVSFDDVYEY